MKKTWLLLMCVALLSGCAILSKVEVSTFTAPDHSYSAELPVGWVRFHQLIRSANDVFITYDGPNIERIVIAKRRNVDFFPKIKKAAGQNILAFELAEWIIAELKADKATNNLEVLENSPAMISGLPGVRLRMRAKNNKGMEFEMLVYSVVGKNDFYTLAYQAPRLHYFQKYSGVFEKIVESFRLL